MYLVVKGSEFNNLAGVAGVQIQLPEFFGMAQWISATLKNVSGTPLCKTQGCLTNCEPPQVHLFHCFRERAFGLRPCGFFERAEAANRGTVQSRLQRVPGNLRRVGGCDHAERQLLFDDLRVEWHDAQFYRRGKPKRWPIMKQSGGGAV